MRLVRRVSTAHPHAVLRADHHRRGYFLTNSVAIFILRHNKVP